MRLCCLDLHGKSFYLQHMLMLAGHEFSPTPDRFDYELLLVDTDHPMSPPFPQKRDLVKEAVRRGVPVVVYPHGGPPDLDLDGLRKSAIPVSAQLAHGEGHAEVNRRFGSNRRVEVVGWMYGPLLPALPGGPYIESILFAPIHPWANGKDILAPHRVLNHLAYQEFLNHPAPKKVVRMVGEDYPNGIYERVEGVEYTHSDYGPAHEQIMAADAVISYGTLAYTALAMGKPTVMIYAYPGHCSDDGKTEATHFPEYADYVKYPASFGLGNQSLDELLRMDVSEWVELFVGKPLDIDLVNELFADLRPSRAVRRAMARA